MPARAPAEIGTPLAEIETPALLVEAESFGRNLERMAQFASRSRVGLRAHVKTHKSPDIALKQIALGAVGVCCQTVGEAEAMVAAGIDDVLVSNQVVSRRALDRLASLAHTARIGVCVDDAANVTHLSAAANRQGVTLDVLVEIDVGANRCGVQPGAPAVALARLVDSAPGLRFVGLQAYNGPAQHFREHEARRVAIAESSRLSDHTRNLLRDSGLQCRVISGAGTGTYELEAAGGVLNELQAGTYVFMDAAYSRNLEADGRAFDTFEQSLFVLTTVISRVTPERAVVDAGLKAIGVDAGLPVIANLEGAEYIRAADEHGTIDLRACPGPLPSAGEQLKLIPGNCDPTVNLHDWIVVARAGRVEALWPVTARGPG